MRKKSVEHRRGGWVRPALGTLLLAGSLQAIAAPLTTTLEETFEGDAAQDYLGTSVALSGNLALIGAPSADPNGSFSGAAYLYAADTGTLLQTFTGIVAGDELGTSVALSGSLALVGAPYADPNGLNDSGAAYLYDTDTGNLLQTFEGGVATDRLGSSVALSGNLALVGAPSADPNGFASGAAYLYNTDTGQLLQTFTGGSAGDEFGNSVALSDDLALVGAIGFGADSNGLVSGAAYLYSTATGDLLQTFTGSTVDDLLGASVALSGNRALVGAPGANVYGPNSGAAYLYDTDSGELLQTLEAGGGGLFPRRYPVALSGNLALVGAYDADRNGLDNNGAAYLYNIDTGTLLQTFAGDAELDRLGRSVALSDNLALIGAADADPNGPQSGAAYLYSLSLPQQGVPAPGTLALAVLGLAATAGRRATRGPF